MVIGPPWSSNCLNLICPVFVDQNTGAEAQLAALKRKYGESSEAATRATSLRCLRTGSKGETVEKLQRFLEISVDGDFGPMTRKALVLKQQRATPKGTATGIYTRFDDETYELSLLNAESN